MKSKRDEKLVSAIEHKLVRLRLPDQDQCALVAILAEPISYIPHSLVRQPAAMRETLAHDVLIMPGTSLKGDEERTLFLQLNYARHLMCQLRRSLLGQTRWPKKSLLQLLHWSQFQLEIRSKIVTANMGLVLAMAKRSDFPGIEFTDLVSEGSMALLRATEKFDCERGFKFSTYACRAIFKGFSRTAKQNYRYRNRFPTQWDVTFEKDDQLERARNEQRDDWVDEVRTIFRRNLADLSDIEQSVVKMRFSLDDIQDEPLTLKQVGDKLGLTKERIRQIQNKALAKIRETAHERMEPA